jgi:alanine-synthesizing transaminase
MFSGRVPASLLANRLSTEQGRLGREGRSILDLTLSNPTHAGLTYPDGLLVPLGHPRGLDYTPQPFGLRAARDAVSREYARQGLAVSPEQIVLTASTSEAYSLLFKVLCDPGDEVLIPRPSYPLFEHLTQLDAVTPVPYDLEYHGAWSIDLAGLERALTDRTRVLLLVNPNNPTGHFVSASELERIAALARTRDLTVIADEVFADYEFAPAAERRAGRLAERSDILNVSLGGLSKSIGLPQVKLAWMALGGPSATVAQARTRLELACDTYLSVSTPVQAAAAELLANGADIRRQIQSRVTMNYRHLAARAARTPSCHVLNADGGWYAVLQVPSLMSEEDLVLSLLTDDSVLVHPGYFFDFPSESFLVVSLLPREFVFADAVDRVFRRFDQGHWP